MYWKFCQNKGMYWKMVQDEEIYWINPLARKEEIIDFMDKKMKPNGGI